MKGQKKKEITLKDVNKSVDDLAIMIAKGFDGVNADIGDLKHRLQMLDVRLEAVEGQTGVNGELLRKIRQEILDLGIRFVSRHEFERSYKHFNEQIDKLYSQMAKVSNRK